MDRVVFQKAKGPKLALTVAVNKFLKKRGFSEEEQSVVKTLVGALFATYAIFGVCEYNGVDMTKRMPRDESAEEEMRAHECVRMLYPYRGGGKGEEEAGEVFVLEGGVSGTMNEAKGFEGSDTVLELRDKKYDEEALKVWLRMRGEVAYEIQEKGGVVA